jgi:hypothetical protein
VSFTQPDYTTSINCASYLCADPNYHRENASGIWRPTYLVRRLCLVIVFAGPLELLRGQVPATAPPLDNPETEQRITKLLGEMTLEEQIGQLVHFADSSTGPGAPHPDYREQITQGNVGSERPGGFHFIRGPV